MLGRMVGYSETDEPDVLMGQLSEASGAPWQRPANSTNPASQTVIRMMARFIMTLEGSDLRAISDPRCQSR